MLPQIIDISDTQAEDLDALLESYDADFIGDVPSGDVNIGLVVDGELVAGAVASLTSFSILYVSTIYVNEAFRGFGLGRKLMDAVEERARAIGARFLRLDTFDWQGVEFYRALGFEEVGSYDADGFSEHFFLKRL
ncbi:MAG: GNAT family N-acetyltransferase [Promicromonosporaceae bacterium]|nr:GNAT family N-acetyltransferase [Promicromonosporaceae bacterium]